MLDGDKAADFAVIATPPQARHLTSGTSDPAWRHRFSFGGTGFASCDMGQLPNGNPFPRGRNAFPSTLIDSRSQSEMTVFMDGDPRSFLGRGLNGRDSRRRRE